MKERKTTSIKGLSAVLVLKNLALLGILMITVPVQVFSSEKP